MRRPRQEGSESAREYQEALLQPIASAYFQPASFSAKTEHMPEHDATKGLVSLCGIRQVMP